MEMLRTTRCEINLDKLKYNIDRMKNEIGPDCEAMAIIKGMLDKQPELNSLIIVPDTLLYQWQTEISFKFWYDAPIWNVDELDDSQILIVSFADIVKDYNKTGEIAKDGMIAWY